MTLPLTDQIRAVERELALRQRVYASRVAAGKMKQGQADKEIALMKAVLETLKRVSAPRNIIGDWVCGLEPEQAIAYLSGMFAEMAGTAAAAAGLDATLAMLDRAKAAATEAAAHFKARAN